MNHGIQLVLIRILMIPTNRTPKLLPPANRNQRNKAKGKKLSPFPRDHRVIVASGADDAEVFVALEIRREVLRAADEEEKHWYWIIRRYLARWR